MTIDGAQGVTLMGLTVQNSPGQGILGVGGAAFVVKDSTLQNNGVGGIFLNNNSSAELTDVEVKDSRGIGIAVFNNSTAVFKGHVSRLAVVVLSVVQMASPSKVGRRWKFGVRRCRRATTAEAGSTSWTPRPLSSGIRNRRSVLTAENNTLDGIFVANGSLSVFGATTSISTSNNGGSGITIEIGGAVVSPGGAAKFMIENDQQNGLNVGGGGSALIIGGLTMQNNQTGLLADGAGTLTLLVLDPSNPSSIQNNSGTDVDLKFGTRVTFQDVAIGSITCDATVLSRGTTVCP